MKRKFGFNARLNMINTMVKKRLLMSVLAEEPTGTEPPKTEPQQTEPPKAEPPKSTVNFEDLVARARKEEKDKLYPQIEGLKKEKDSLTEKINGHLLTIAEKDKTIETLTAELDNVKTTANKNDDEVVKTLKAEVKALKKSIADMEQEKVDVSALEEKIKGEYEVKLYREQKLREGGTEIIPELVGGLTKEDIDNSFEVAKQRYADIIKNVVSTATSKIPTVNTSTEKFSIKDFKAEDIANMTPSQWAEHRKKLGLG